MKLPGGEKIIRTVSLTVMGCLAATVLIVLAQRVAWRFPLENFEGACVDVARHWHAGHHLYADAAKGELPVYNYPPLYIFFVSLWPDVARPFLPGRLVSLAALMGAAFFAAFFVHRLTGEKRLAFWTACFFLVVPENAFLGALVRADTLAAFFSLAALVVGFDRYPDKKGLALAAILGVAAWFAKQTALAGPAALILWLAVTNRKAAWWFGSLYAGLLAAAIGAAEWISGGLFLKNVISYSVTDYSFGRLWFFVSNYVSFSEPFHGAIVVGALAGAAAVARRGWRDSPVLFYLALTALSLVSLGKDGATRLYLFEFHLAAAMAAGVGLNAIGTTHRRAGTALLAALSLGSLAVVPFLIEVRSGTATEDANEQWLVELMRRVEGPVLAEDAGYAVLAGRDNLEMTNPFLAKRLAERGLIDMEAYLDKVRAGWYAAIVLDSPAHHPNRVTYERYPASLLIEITTRYRQTATLGNHVVYLPRAAAEEN